jgi:uncharacterized protein YhhL (DUF1145 family)
MKIVKLIRPLLGSRQFVMGVALLIVTVAMTIVALVTPLGKSVNYVTFISHIALVLTAVQIIQLSVEARQAKKRDPNDPTE